jgi:GGDEF domain-containing protein
MPTPAVFRFQLTRTGIHVLLALVMMLGLGLSLSTSHMVGEVQRASALLLGHDVPKLERLGAFKSALLQHQAALDNYFAAPAQPEHFRQAEVHALRVMRANYLDVVGETQGTPDQAALEREFARLEGLGAALRSALDGERAGARARQVLAELNACTNTIRELVDRSRRRVEEDVAENGRTSMDRTSRIATLVHLYIGFALLSAVALFHHVRARMKSEDALAYLARHDQMTRLPHRWAFFERIERLHRQRPAQGDADAGPQLLVVEADRFDRVVAGIGHPGAEQLVQQLALRVDEVARAIGGEAYRLGDSKFALLLARDVEEAGAQQVAARLQARMAEPVLAGQHEVVLSARPPCPRPAAVRWRWRRMPRPRCTWRGARAAPTWPTRASWTIGCARTWRSRRSCAMRSNAANWSCITSRSSAWRTACWSASRRCCAGSAPGPRSLPRNSSRWPRSPA